MAPFYRGSEEVVGSGGGRYKLQQKNIRKIKNLRYVNGQTQHNNVFTDQTLK